MQPDKAHRHPELTEQTVWEVFEAERPKRAVGAGGDLTPVPGTDVVIFAHSLMPKLEHQRHNTRPGRNEALAALAHCRASQIASFSRLDERVYS
jgi:hypothetical protein